MPCQPPANAENRLCCWPSTVTSTEAAWPSMATGTGNAPGACSPRASNASATSPATISCRADSSLVFSLGAKLDELDPRRPTSRALARQHRIDNFEMAGQTLPGRGRVRGTGADGARLVSHRLRPESLLPLPLGPVRLRVVKKDYRRIGGGAK